MVGSDHGMEHKMVDERARRIMFYQGAIDGMFRTAAAKDDPHEWMITALLGCLAMEIRAHSQDMGWDRRKIYAAVPDEMEKIAVQCDELEPY